MAMYTNAPNSSVGTFNQKHSAVIITVPNPHGPGKIKTTLKEFILARVVPDAQKYLDSGDLNFIYK